jgi:hypothetical protein
MSLTSRILLLDVTENGPCGLVAEGGMSALGHKRTCAVQQPMSALHPMATAKADMPQMVMSALLPKADVRIVRQFHPTVIRKFTHHAIDFPSSAASNFASCP